MLLHPCPEGHGSRRRDRCDVCGTAFGPGTAAAAPDPGAAGSGRGAPSRRCPGCGGLNLGGARFCEDCGRDLAPAGGVVTAAPVRWIAEVWVDPDWYATHRLEAPCPAVGEPTVVPVEGTALIGRASRSRNVVPDIDLRDDPGVSRPHARLTADGCRWRIEDLHSANGTHLGATAAGARPVGPGRPAPVGAGEHLYLGYHTRIVLRHRDP